MSEEVELNAPGIGKIKLIVTITATPHGGYYDPQYQIVGATPEDVAKLCRIKDVQAFLDTDNEPGAPVSNAQRLADKLEGMATTKNVEGLPQGAELNAPDDRLGTEARQATP